MTQLENKDVILRAIEPEDIDLLFELENDTDLWKYSNRSQPYSKHLLKNYITNAHKHIFEFRQIKFTIIIDNPKPQKFSFNMATGGWVVAPIVTKLIDRIAPILGVKPHNLDLNNMNLEKYTIRDRKATL